MNVTMPKQPEMNNNDASTNERIKSPTVIFLPSAIEPFFTRMAFIPSPKTVEKLVFIPIDRAIPLTRTKKCDETESLKRTSFSGQTEKKPPPRSFTFEPRSLDTISGSFTGPKT